MISRVLDVTFTALVIYWIATRPREFGAVTTAATTSTIGAVKALWGK